MRTFMICGLLALVAVASALPEWESFKKMHGKKYESTVEESLRKSIFLENKRMIEEFNKNEAHKAGFTMGINKFSDRTSHEIPKWPKSMSRPEIPERSSGSSEFLNKLMATPWDEIPESVDYRKEGRVTDVKDQGDCSSDYAFVSTGVLEGQMKIRNKTMVSLSAQNALDCSTRNLQCVGGFPVASWYDMRDEGGVMSEADYLYRGRVGHCLFDGNRSVFDVSGGSYLHFDENEEYLRKLVATFGPVAVILDSEHASFHHYKGGVYFEKDCRPDYFEQSLVLVGYGTDPKEGDYWLLKNSWGKSWGEEGYMRLARNKNNHCAIATSVMIPEF